EHRQVDQRVGDRRSKSAGSRVATGDDLVEDEVEAERGDRSSDDEAVEPERCAYGTQPFTNEEGDRCDRARIEGEPENVADRREGCKRFVLRHVVVELTDRIEEDAGAEQNPRRATVAVG